MTNVMFASGYAIMQPELFRNSILNRLIRVDMDESGSLVTQLREANRFTAARWSVWVDLSRGSAQFFPPGVLGVQRRQVLSQFLTDASIVSWLAGALSSARVRSHRLPESARSLGCRQVFAFPNTQKKSVLLVGADDLDKSQRGIFRLLSLQAPVNGAVPATQTGEPAARSAPDVQFEVPYNQERVLSHILNGIVQAVRCDAAYLAVRRGSAFRIQAVWNCPAGLVGADIDLDERADLQRLVEARQSAVVPVYPHEAVAQAILAETGQAPREALKAPVILGDRVIAKVVLLSQAKGHFSGSHANRLAKQVASSALAIENSIVFSEAVQQLEQVALLNDLALAASGGLGADEASRRVLMRLRRYFNISLARIFLLSSDGQSLVEYGSEQEDTSRLVLPVTGSLAGYVVETLLPVRVGDITQAPRFYERGEDVRSALFVPLKYRGMPVGAICLLSALPDAFTAQDEQLLTVIASHLAGMLVNSRLHQEARERAGKLTLIHEVIQRVLNLRDEGSIAQEASELIASFFNYEIVQVLILDETNQFLTNLGAGGSMSHVLIPGYQFPANQGLVGRVLRTSLSAIYNDVEIEPDYYSVPGWVAGSEMCIPLRDRDHLIGLINVERRVKNSFSDSDLLTMESLAGILSSVLINARRYRELHLRIEAQQIAEHRLVRSARLAAVGEMAAGVAHELNNPLTTVMGFLELALEDLPQGSMEREDLELALREAQRAREVVRRLLDFSRQTSNIAEPSQINELIQDVVPLIQHQLQTSGVAIQLDLAEGLPDIAVNPNQIKQVILNLLQNALQAMPDGGSVSVKSGRELRTDGLGVFVKVCDTGEGIPPEYYERIFEPFFTTRPQGKGTGLGLSVSYGIITSHGGQIDVDSVMGRGSCFTIWLPVEAV